MEINAKYGTALETKQIDALLERDKEQIRQEQKFRQMELLDLITNKTKCKVFHLEIFENNRLYIGAGIKANSLEEAEIIMRGCFRRTNK